MSKEKRAVIGLVVALAVLIPLYVYGAYLGRSSSAPIEALCSDRDCLCGDWAMREVGHYAVENNVWNKGRVSTYEQCVYILEGENGLEAGWAWNWPGVRLNVVAYPNIMFGKQPWQAPTSSKLPRPVRDITCLEASFDVRQEGSGRGNLAFDLWITDSDRANPADITHEIMIWLSHTGVPTAGRRRASLELDGRSLGLWVKEDHNPSEDYAWTYLAFLFKSDFTAGTVDVAALLDYLVENDFLAPDHYLASIQLGNEIVSGYGQTLLRSFEVRFCD